MTLGAISWAEHYVDETGGTAVWQDSWELSDPYGTSVSLVPPTTSTAIYTEDANPKTPSPVQWQTAPESFAKVFSYDNGANPPCFRVFLRNGVMEEFGCRATSLAYYPQPTGPHAGQDYMASWLLDLIVEPNGNQIQVNYQQDMETASGVSYPRDTVLGTVQWDSPTCLNTVRACDGNGTPAWAPQMQVTFQASHAIAYVAPGGSSCAAQGNLRCDDPLDLSGSGGIGARWSRATSCSTTSWSRSATARPAPCSLEHASRLPAGLRPVARLRPSSIRSAASKSRPQAS